MAVTEAPKLGLRFARSQRHILRRLADRVRNGEFPGDIDTFEQAAMAAELGEPLVVICNNRDEVEAMAALYARLGVKQPGIEELNG